MKFFYYEQLLKDTILSKYYCKDTIIKIDIENDIESQLLYKYNTCVHKLIIYGNNGYINSLNLKNFPNLKSLHLYNITINQLSNIQKLNMLKIISSDINYIPLDMPLKYFSINYIEFTDLYKKINIQTNWNEIYRMFKHKNINNVSYYDFENQILNIV
jgi:hypothetical protein